MLRFARTYFSKERKKKKEKKKKKESLLTRRGKAFCQGFFNKIQPEVRGWRFFKKPEGLDLYKTKAEPCVAPPIFAVVFCFYVCKFT
jgi:hypothetical protein